MQVQLSKKATKQLRKIPLKDYKKVVRKLRYLENNTYSGKLLEGEYKNFRSLRAWPYRIIYQVDGKTVTIFSIAHRQSAYKS